MIGFSESALESAVLAWLAGLGYTIRPGPLKRPR